MKSYIYWAIHHTFVLVVLIFPIKLFSQDLKIRDGVLLVAQRDYLSFINNIPIGMEKEFGFNNRTDFNEATLGKPINVIFPVKDIFNRSNIDTTSTNLEISSIWEIPVIANGDGCCLLRMISLNDSCSIIGIGGVKSAKIIDDIIKTNDYAKTKDLCILSISEVKDQYLIFYSKKLDYTNSKCYKIENKDDKASKALSNSLLGTLESSKRIFSERKENNYEY